MAVINITTRLDATRAREIVQSQLRGLAGDVAAVCRETLLQSRDLSGKPLRIPQRLGGEGGEFGEFDKLNDVAAQVVRSRRKRKTIFELGGIGGPGIDTGAMLNMLSQVGRTAAISPNMATISMKAQAGRSLRFALFANEGKNGMTDPTEYLKYYEDYTGGRVFGVNMKTGLRMANRLRNALGAH